MDWRSYDSVAETYERIHAPRLAEPCPILEKPFLPERLLARVREVLDVE